MIASVLLLLGAGSPPGLLYGVLSLWSSTRRLAPWALCATLAAYGWLGGSVLSIPESPGHELSDAMVKSMWLMVSLSAPALMVPVAVFLLTKRDLRKNGLAILVSMLFFLAAAGAGWVVESRSS